MGMDCVQDKYICRERTVGADVSQTLRDKIVADNKYGSQPIINVFSKYRCLSASFRCAVFVVMTVRWLTMKAN